ncbi:hypothetical protein FACS1894156_4600 [Bacteroidia bacterium]|nr:hypothetical protein FACS1894156_4600 [Bacteroidia bacterium]
MAKKVSHTQENLEHIEHGLSKAEVFIEKYQRTLLYAGIAAIILAGAYLGYKYWYKAPLEEEAQAQLFQAQQWFGADSLQMALNGDGSFLGLTDVADQYSSTAAGNAACFYAGIAYLHLGQYEDALAYFKRSKGKDWLGKALLLGNIGDAYSELGDLDEAARYYKKAAGVSDNAMTAPRFFAKAALVLEKQGNYAEAIRLYEKIQHNFSNTTEANDAEKHIARAKVLSGKE